MIPNLENLGSTVEVGTFSLLTVQTPSVENFLEGFVGLRVIATFPWCNAPEEDAYKSINAGNFDLSSPLKFWSVWLYPMFVQHDSYF